MTEAYKVSVELELEDKFTAKLKEIAKKLEEAGEKVDKAGEGLKKFSEGGNSFVEMLNDTTRSLTALGSNGGLKSAVSSFDKMAAASASIAANMRAAQAEARRLGGTTFHGQGHNKLSHPSNSGASPIAEEAAAVAHEARNSKGDASGLKSALKEFGGELAKEIGSKIAEAATEALKDGIKKNADLEDINKRTVQQSKVSDGQIDGLMNELTVQERAYQTNFHGDLESYALAIQKTAEFHPRDTPEQRKAARGFTDETVEISAYSAKNGDKGVAELAPLLEKFGKNANTTTAEDYKTLLESASAASHKEGVNISEIAEAGKSAIRASENAAGHFDTYTMMLATMIKTGTADKGGDLGNDMSVDKLAAKLDGRKAEDKERLKAGQHLGLYDDKGQATFMEGGNFNLGKEMSLIAQAMLEARKNGVGAEERVSEQLHAVFKGKGTQADSLLEVLKLDTVNLEEFANITKNVDAAKGDEGFRERFEKQKTANEMKDEIKENLDVTAMNATVSLMGPIKLVLDKGVDASKGLETFTKDHPVLAAGALVGTAVAGYAAKAKGFGKLFGAGGEIGAAAEGAEPATAGAEAEGVAAIGVEAAAGAEGLAALGVALGPVILGIGALAGVTAGMGWLLTNVVDPDTDEMNHPGKRRYHKRGQADEWRTDESLSQEHAGQHFVRAGRGGGWVPDAPDSPDASKQKSAEVPSFLQTIFGGKGEYAATGRSRSGLPRGTPAAELPDKALPSPPIPPKSGALYATDEKSKMQAIAENANNYVEKNFNFAFYIDGKEIAAHMIPANSNGTSSFNTAATRPSPNGSAYGH